MGELMIWKFHGLFALGLIMSISAHASLTAEQELELNQTISKVEVKEIPAKAFTDKEIFALQEAFSTQKMVMDQVNPLDQAGKVITMGKDLVALGESVYQLVIKGKPTNTTKYAPISVIPKVGTEPVDIFETENWKMPVKKTFEVTYTNIYGIKVIKFRYSVIFSYGGTYNGKGAYLTAAQVIPEYADTMFGFDFTATMKLGGIQNQGKRDNPIAGATLLMEYSAQSVMKVITRVDTFFITGRGGFKKY